MARRRESGSEERRTMEGKEVELYVYINTKPNGTLEC